MATDYIQSAAGTTNPILTLRTTVSGDLDVPALKDVTINMANDIFTWTQLNEAAKLSLPTTSTNSISANLVVEPTIWFGSTGATTGSAAKLGLQGLSDAKTEVTFEINFGAKTLSGTGYVASLAPTVSADAPVWVSPITIAVSGSYTVA